MNLTFKIINIITVLLLCVGNVQAQNMQAKVIAYKDCHPNVNELDFQDKPHDCNMSQQTVTFMVEGKNIAIIDEESLKFSKLSVGNEDFRHNRKGDNKFKLGSFPQVDDDGKFAIFSVELDSIPFGKVSSLAFDGSVDVFTSKRVVIEEKKSLDVVEGYSFRSGPFVISNQKQPEKTANKIGEALSKGIKTAFLGDTEDSLVVFVKGNLEALVGLEVYENGEKLESGWSSWSNNEKTFTFSKPAGSKINIKLKYWDGLERLTLPLKHNL